jgi:type VI secretion system protein ImpB
MASQGSVAPKERVNIVYRPATEGAQEEVELPLKLLVLGDFTLRDDDTALDELSPVNIDKDNFNDVLAAQAPRLQLQVPDLLQGRRGQTLQLDLCFRQLADFAPDSLVRQAPQLQALLQLREALKALKGPLSNIPAFRRRLQDIIADPQLRERLIAELRQAAPQDAAPRPVPATAPEGPAQGPASRAESAHSPANSDAAAADAASDHPQPASRP